MLKSAKGFLVLALDANAKIFLCQIPVDLRKGFEGLSCLVETALGQNVTSGTYFVFLNHRRDRMKVLYWDGDGLAIWYKRLEKGSFTKNTGKAFMRRRDFFMLLEGIIPKRIQKRFKLE